MDVEKCYPNILSLESAQIIRRMWEESDMVIAGIEADHLCRYLGKYLKPTEVVEEGFKEILYTRKDKKKVTTKKTSRKHAKKRKVKIKDKINNIANNSDNRSNEGADTLVAATEEDEYMDIDNNLDNRSNEGADTLVAATEEDEYMDIDNFKGADTLETVQNKKNTIEKKKKKKKQEWIKPKRKPTLTEERKLFGKALELLLVTCMDNHVYQFDRKVRVQSKGGPIGLKLTGEIFDCIMIDWDKKLLAELDKFKLAPEIYTRFKDDIEISIEALEKGSTVAGDKIIVDDSKKKLDTDKTDNKVTMEVIQKIANSINPMVKLTIDTPCNYVDGKLPVLDVMVNVNEKEGNRIDFEFFEKPTKNPRVILASSALSHSQKRTIMTQECLRRLRNTKVELGPEVQRKHLNLFMLRLKNSGYNRKFRKEILDSALNAFEKMVANDKNGIKPLYRSKTWNIEERMKAKLNRKQNWWNKESSKVQYKSVLFVTPTPGGVLASQLRKREEELNRHSGERIKIVERGGMKIKDILGSKNPIQTSKCTQKVCPLCTKSKHVEPDEEKRYPCNTNNVGYRWRCLKCQELDTIKVYEGESGRSARIRGGEHLRDLEKKREKSALYKHVKNFHNNEKVKFRMEITKKFKDALTRQANEAVRIFSQPGHQLLNSKSEFNHPPLARVVVEKKNKWGCGKPQGVNTVI